MERLRGTAIRLEQFIQEIPTENLTKITLDKWSVQEHAGHLLDLESLWFGRIGDIIEGKKILREADLSNKKTHEANHNDRDVQEILMEFKVERKKLTDALSAVPQKDFEKTALHPRLLVPMKMIDLAYFVAEHDDHHLAMMRWIEGEF